jgi:hypothetical protein
LKLLLALMLLNSVLTFQNHWPTVGVRWTLEGSLDLLGLLLALAALTTWRGALGRTMRWAILGIYLVLVLGRYLDVTAPALMGRTINLYWDSQHLPNVLAMFTAQLSSGVLLLGGLALLAFFGLLIALLRWALNTVLAALARPAERRAISAVAAALLILYVAGRWSVRLPTERGFALPVSAMLVKQARLTLAATVFRADDRFKSEPLLPESNLGRLQRGDLFVIFFESYGALTFDDPRFAAPLAGDFAAMERELNAAGWQVASARAESSTFGGGSWLAHSSLLSGVRIADQGDYQTLLTTDRPTLAHRFAAAGYRPVAVMPGLKFRWPEGQFYGFADLYQPEQLAYHGSAYGWWAIPDQYSLYRIHRSEVERANRAPLFIFFPTISSHIPFAPLPPYRLNWRSFDALADDSAATIIPEEPLAGAELAAAYLRSVRYNLAVLSGYLRQYAPPEALVLALGDHQPPAVVGGRDLLWQVPVHLFSRNPALLARFTAAGFQPGIQPGSTALGGIERLGPVLLDALDSR